MSNAAVQPDSRKEKAMSKVYLHVKTILDDDWDNSSREFFRLPCVGEYIYLPDQWQGWYEVKLVIHVPVPENEYVAEVYAVGVDQQAVKKELFGGDTGELLLW